MERVVKTESRILIYGADDLIGHQFIIYLENSQIPNLKYFKGSAKIDNIKDVEKEIKRLQPSHILSLKRASQSNKFFLILDYLDEDGKLIENVKEDMYCPLALAQISQINNIHLTYFSFCSLAPIESNNLTLEEIKEVESTPDQFRPSLKGFTDNLMNLFPNVLNFGIHKYTPRQIIHSMDINLMLNEKMPLPNEDNTTVQPEFFPIVFHLLFKKRSGTYNFINSSLKYKQEVLKQYQEQKDPEFVLKNFSIEEIDKNNNEPSEFPLTQSELEEKKADVDKNNVENNSNKLSNKSRNYFYDLDILKKVASFIENQNNLLKNKKEFSPTVENFSLIKSREFVDSEDTNILVTGGCGFIGSNFINFIFEKYQKIKIINLDAMYYCASENNVNEEVRNSPRYVLIKGNVCSKNLLDQILNQYNINFVIHFAAQSSVEKSFTEDSVQFSIDNVVGTHTLLESCRLYNKLLKFIYISTDEVYGQSDTSFYDMKYETSLLKPTNPYSATKSGADLIAQSYFQSYKMPIVITRSNNIYGPNQYPEKVIPLFIKLLKADKRVTINGKGEAMRSFLNVKDASTAFEIILCKGKVGEIYNIGCDEGTEEYSVLNLSKILIKMVKNTEDYEKWISFIPDRPLNDARYLISNEKLKRLGWKITIGLIEGLKELV
jgi:dTDP-glucose 4,6-dehydratase